jgi:hypothetical protein
MQLDFAVLENGTAILPCNDIDAAQSFFERLGFKLDEGSRDGYRMPR